MHLFSHGIHSFLLVLQKKTAEVHSGGLSCGIYTKSQWLLYAMDALSHRFDKHFANLIYWKHPSVKEVIV